MGSLWVLMLVFSVWRPGTLSNLCVRLSACVKHVVHCSDRVTDKNDLKEGGFILPHDLGIQSIMVGKVQR